jgi:hypothetical protein
VEHQTEAWVKIAFLQFEHTDKNLNGPSLVSRDPLSFKLNNMFSQMACIAICSLIIGSAQLQLSSETPHKFIKSMNVLLLR